MAGECGQASVPPSIAPYAEEFAGLTKGTCSSQGYTQADGSKTIQVPVIGDISIALYSKALLNENVPLYSITAGECGEVSIPSAYEKFVEKWGALTEGTCASQDYTVVEEGTKDYKIPFVGDVKVTVYTKAGDVKKHGH